MHQLSLFKMKAGVVNVASVPQRSPFRYPGGKTWAIPTIRKWLAQGNVELLLEPFAGGGIVSLTAAAEGLAKKVVMIELDSEVSAVWETILSDYNEWLVQKILSFELTLENIQNEINREEKQVREVAFCTILKNRTYHGGILAKGSGIIKSGENGKGISSRWYPGTLATRIRNIAKYKDLISACQGDAFEYMDQNLETPNCYFFIDPPYFKAGKRLYTHYQVDHERLFQFAKKIQGKFLMTYDLADEIIALAKKYQLHYTTVPMKTTHHLKKEELLISDNLDWL